MTPIQYIRTFAIAALVVGFAVLPSTYGQTSAPVIDGKLDDAFWSQVAPQRLEPAQAGVSADLGGEIRVIVRGHHLLVAARLPEPTGRVTARVTGRHPDWEDEDMLQLTAGPDIGYTDRYIRINPFGAFTVEREGQEVYTNADRYLIATAIHDNEWTVEAAIPLNEVSAPGPEPVLVSAQRVRAQRQGSPQQRWRWPRYDPATKAAVDRSAPWETAAPDYRPTALGNQAPALQVGRMPVPSGTTTWDSSEWARVPAWSLVRDEPGGPVPRWPTLVKVIHDGKILSILARLTEPEEIVATVKERDGRVDRDDSFQVYLGASGSSYAQVAVNALGYVLDLAAKTGGPRISRPRLDWDSEARTSVRRGEGFWTARVDIPLEKILNILGEPESQTEMRVHFVRVRPGRNNEVTEVSALSVIPAQTATGSIRYRRMHLSDTSPENLPHEEVPDTRPPLNTRVWDLAERKHRHATTMVDDHLRSRVTKALETEWKAWSNVRTKQDWEAYRTKRMEGLSRFIGEFPQREPLNVTMGKEYLGEGYRRLDIVYRSRENFWIAANLYLPAQTRGRTPALIIIPSHHRPRMQFELQDMGILWARQGSAVLIADNLGHGERIQTYPWNREGYQSRYNLGMQLYVAGESLIKWMVWDTMRAVDVLLERDDIDPEKIILLGAVAAGGDPAAITAALDPRIAAVAPFNYGEASPEHAGRANLADNLADPGWGSWESTRNLPRSIADQFMPWFICASVAPRKFIFSYEMGWNVEEQPAWRRYRKVFGFYDALDNLAEAHGFGGFPGPGECANIGPSQRKTLYPTLSRWFAIPAPLREPDDRRTEAELYTYSPELASRLQDRPAHKLAHEIGEQKLEKARETLARLDEMGRIRWLRSEWSKRLGDVEPNLAPNVSSVRIEQLAGFESQALTLEVEPGIAVPMLLLRSTASIAPKSAVVVAVSRAGKERMWREHHTEISELLQKGIAVCLPDLRGTGESEPDMRRGPSSTEVSSGATELMLGSSLLGARLKDLRTVLAYLRTRDDVDGSRIAIWGDSESQANPRRPVLDESPGWQIGPDLQYECDPLGGLLAMFSALYEGDLRAIATRRGLISFESLLEDTFAYVPAHVIVPDMLSAGDLSDITASLRSTAMLLESPVDARNLVVAREELRNKLEPVARKRGQQDSEAFVFRTASEDAGFARWLADRLQPGN